jgi:hypothetical protein
LSRKALKVYVEGPLQVCNADMSGSMEDVIFTRCVHQYISNETFIDTRDEAGAHRYHAHSPRAFSIWPEEMQDSYMKAHGFSMKHMRHKFGFPYVVKEAYISNSSVTFHRLAPVDVRRMEMLLYSLY